MKIVLSEISKLPQVLKEFINRLQNSNFFPFVLQKKNEKV